MSLKSQFVNSSKKNVERKRKKKKKEKIVKKSIKKIIKKNKIPLLFIDFALSIMTVTLLK